MLPTAVLQPVCQWLQPITLTAPRGPRRSLLHTQYCTSAVPRSVLLYGFKKAFILERHPLSTCEERCRQRLCCLVLGCFVLLLLLFICLGLFGFVLFSFKTVVEIEHTSSQMLGKDSTSELQALSPGMVTPELGRKMHCLYS